MADTVISDKHYTIAAFDQITAAHPERLLELINGRIVEKVVGRTHGRAAANILTALVIWDEASNINGHYGVEVQHFVDQSIPFKPLPDVSFSYGGDAPDGGTVRGMPDFVAEVKSPSNTYAELREKAHLYIQHGTRLVWLVFPGRNSVDVYLPDGSVTTYDKTEQVLSGGEVLPGFSMTVGRILR